jgi:hypothetical protein
MTESNQVILSQSQLPLVKIPLLDQLIWIEIGEQKFVIDMLDHLRNEELDELLKKHKIDDKFHYLRQGKIDAIRNAIHPSDEREVPKIPVAKIIMIVGNIILVGFLLITILVILAN